jgi:hypothetical protein
MGVVTNTLNLNQACINACNRCAQGCSECFALCLNEPEERNRSNLLKELSECSKICQTASMLIMCGSKFAKQFCRFCADVCESCSAACGQFPEQHYKKCAEECTVCAAECKNM